MFDRLSASGAVALAGLAAGLAGCGSEAPRASTVRAPADGAAPNVTVRSQAASYRRTLRDGQVLGTVSFPGAAGAPEPIRVGLDQPTVDRGPGWYPRSGLPGEGRLVYLAGHRRSHGGPFGPVARLARGDRVVLTLPYATAAYRVTRRQRISARDVTILRSPGHELLRLQTSTLPAGDERVIVTAQPLRLERASE